MPRQTKQRILRAKGASENGFESLSLFIGGVIAANQAGLETSTLNSLSIGYLLIRLAYVFAYVKLGENAKLAPIRSLIWVTSVGISLTMYIKAGLKTMN